MPEIRFAYDGGWVDYSRIREPLTKRPRRNWDCITDDKTRAELEQYEGNRAPMSDVQYLTADDGIFRIRDAILSAAQDLERRTKTKGKQFGAIGDAGMQILERLLTRHSGCPSMDEIASFCRYSRETTRNGWKRLQTAGIIRVE
jgi:hypothetical protein